MRRVAAVPASAATGTIQDGCEVGDLFDFHRVFHYVNHVFCAIVYSTEICWTVKMNVLYKIASGAG